MNKYRLAFVLTLFLPFSSLYAGNLFEPASGDLVIPAFTVKNNTYSAMFSLTGEQSLQWGTNEIVAGTPGSRTAAQYDPVTGALWVPEINVKGKLYNLGFTVGKIVIIWFACKRTPQPLNPWGAMERKFLPSL